jgi:hypothetical protein
MRWLDINLPEPGTRQNLDRALAAARDAAAALPGIQQRDGLDSPTVTRHMAEVGRMLFQAVLDHDAGAFVPERPDAVRTPCLVGRDHEDTVAYHLVMDDAWRDLPWTWLHNGLEHLLAKHPLCWADHGAGLPDAGGRPWMQRQVQAGFAVGGAEGTDLRHIVRQVRTDGVGRPHMLFVAGHSEEAMRRLIYREAEAIAAALAGSPLGSAVARFEVPADAITPTRLREQALAYQAIHYAGPTSQPAAQADLADERWLEHLIGDATAAPDDEYDSAVGLEELPVGVDQVTALLDVVSERADRGAHYTGDILRERLAGGHTGQSGQWLLDDGPVPPEGFGRGGGLPPLVFSNHHRALPEMGSRFTRAGASSVIGPLVPLYSRPARRFAEQVYRSMGGGSSAAGAVWRAAHHLRGECGDEHPAWLSYGVQGYGSLALQYL